MMSKGGSGMGKRLVFWKIGWVLLAAGFLFVNGCGRTGGIGGAQDTQFAGNLAVVVTSSTTPLQSDVCVAVEGSGDCLRFADQVCLSVTNRPNDPVFTAISSPYTDVRLVRYDVSFTRTDGGTAVPAPFTVNALAGPLGSNIPQTGTAVSQLIEIVKTNQKAETPLFELSPQSITGGVEGVCSNDPLVRPPCTHIYASANLLLYFEDGAGKKTTYRMSVPIDFANWLNTSRAAPTPPACGT